VEVELALGMTSSRYQEPAQAATSLFAVEVALLPTATIIITVLLH